LRLLENWELLELEHLGDGASKITHWVRWNQEPGVHLLHELLDAAAIHTAEFQGMHPRNRTRIETWVGALPIPGAASSTQEFPETVLRSKTFLQRAWARRVADQRAGADGRR
jgi:hypothetical protein